MGLFFADKKITRKANLCHLLVSHVDEKELVSNYGFTNEEIEDAKTSLDKFDDFKYLQGKINRCFKKS
jgi:hypothetical protein